MPVDISDVRRLVEAQDQWRGRQTINLIASENAQSPAVRQIQNSDFMARYAEGHPNEGEQVNRYYQGTRYIDEIERMAAREMMELMRCRQVDVRPISGNAANTAITLGYLRGGDAVIVNSTDAGGHISHGPVGVFGRRIQVRGQARSLTGKNPIPLHTLPLTEDATTSMSSQHRPDREVSPRMVVLGKSMFLFPERCGKWRRCAGESIPLLYAARTFSACRRRSSRTAAGGRHLRHRQHPHDIPRPQRA